MTKTVESKKSLTQIAIESNERLTSQASNRLEQPLKTALLDFDTILKGFRNEVKREAFVLSIPSSSFWNESASDSLHHPLTRLYVDSTSFVKGITKSIEKYKKSIGDAVMSTYQSADAQSWSTETFESMVDAIGKEADFHSTQIAELLVNYQTVFANAVSYNDILGSGTKLQNDLNAVTEKMEQHLEVIARREKAAKDKLRKE